MQLTDQRCLDLARKYEQYPCSGRSVTLRDHGIVEFARALIAEYEASKFVLPGVAVATTVGGVRPGCAQGAPAAIYNGQPSPGASIALAESEGGEA